MKLTRLFCGWALAAVALIACASPVTAAPLDLTARHVDAAEDWPPGLYSTEPAAVFVVSRDATAPAPVVIRQRGPVGRTAHLFTAAGRWAAANRTAQPRPG